MAIEFDARGEGYVGLAAPNHAIMRHQIDPVTGQGSFSQASAANVHDVYGISGPSGSFAVGLPMSSGSCVYTGSRYATWQPFDYCSSNGFKFSAVRELPIDGTSAIEVGFHQQSLAGVIRRQSMGGASTLFSFGQVGMLSDVEFYGPATGFAVGKGAILQYYGNNPPNAVATLDPRSGASTATFRGDSSGSTDPDSGAALQHTWFWGDGTTSTGSVASHRMRGLGWSQVQVRVQDQYGDFDTETFAIHTTPVTLAEATLASISFLDAGGSEVHHYLVPAVSWEREIQVELTGGAGISVQGGTQNYVGTYGDWPRLFEAGSAAKPLSGTLPGNTPLYLAISQNGESASLAYSIRWSLVPPPPPPEVDALTPVETSVRTVSYLDRVSFSVTYHDGSGRPPTDQAGSPRAPELVVGGNHYVMHAPFGVMLDAAAYQAGVTYTYEVPPLAAPQSHRPTFTAYVGGQRAGPVEGAAVVVTQSHVASWNFNADPVGPPPGMFTPGPGSLNYWRIANTSASSVPTRLSATGHGKALWFGHPTLGSYRDPQGGAPQGYVTSVPLDLRSLSRPVLSFASYYETQDTGLSLDRKRVEVLDATSGAVLTSYSIHGDAGGYAQWRTQLVDLGNFADRIVQLRFAFDTVTNQDNQYLGWFVDDLVVGSDWDADKLPDEVERRRQDVRVAIQNVPIRVPENQQATSYVRRLVRPFAESFHLESIVASPQPSTLTITVGVTPTLGDNQQRTFVLFSGGIDRSGCTTTADNGIERLNRPAVKAVAGGLDIRLDTTRCAALLQGIPASALKTGRDWFLNVYTPTGSGGATIELLRFVSSGRTDPVRFDTPNDGVADGTKVQQLRDPLGYDANNDGIPTLIDPDDTRPSWSPGLGVSSSDYTRSMTFIGRDLVAPLASVAFEARFNSTNQVRGLSPTYVTGTTWKVNPGQFGSLPSGVTIRWRDAYGNHGQATYWMGAQGGNSYVPRAISSFAVDAATSQIVSGAISLEALPSRTSVLYGTETPYADSYEGKQANGATWTIGGTPIMAQGTLGVFSAASRITAAGWSAAHGWVSKTSRVAAPRVPDVVENVASGFRVLIQYTSPSGSLSADQFGDLLRDGTMYWDDAGGMVILRPYNGGTLWGYSKRSFFGAVLMLADVGLDAPRNVLGALDMAGNGYGRYCGPIHTAGASPVDELDASCFVHDRCSGDKLGEPIWLSPFSRKGRLQGCNSELIRNANEADCERTEGLLIETPIPPGYRSFLPAGDLVVQEMTLGSLSPCRTNRDVILTLYTFGRDSFSRPVWYS